MSSWTSPNLSKRDIELLITTLDDYCFYARHDGINYDDVEKLNIRFINHLEKTNGQSNL